MSAYAEIGKVKVWIKIEAGLVVFFTAFGLRWAFGWWMDDLPGSFPEAVYFSIGAMAVGAAVHHGGKLARGVSTLSLAAIALLGGLRRGLSFLWGAEQARNFLPWEAIGPWGLTALYLSAAAVLLPAVYLVFIYELWNWNEIFPPASKGGPHEPPHENLRGRPKQSAETPS